MIAPALETIGASDSVPYRGLEPYTESDWAFFFGRERECEIISANLTATRLTLLYGPSGVGKTSVLSAGVVHNLLDEARSNMATFGAPEHAVVLFRSWADDPVESLKASASEAVDAAFGNAHRNGWISADAGLVEHLEALSTTLNGQILIVLDQFEEYFLYHGQEEGPGTFAIEFPRAVNRASLAVNFLVSIREDALARLDRFKSALPDLFTNYLRLSSLDLEGGRAAIEKPLDVIARARGGQSAPVSIEPALTSEVLWQVSSPVGASDEVGRGVPPDPGRGDIDTSLLQVVMRRVWLEEKREGSSTLRLDTFMRLGTARQILASHLDDLLGELSHEDQDLAAELFRYLVTPSGMKIAWSPSDLESFAGVNQSRIQALMQRLSGPADRILRPVAVPGHTNAYRYEIFHDRLADAILGWRTRHLEERAERELQRELEQARKLRTSGRRAAAVRAVAVTLLILVPIAFLLFQPPDISEFSASQSEVITGAPVNLSWTVDRARTVSIDPDVGAVDPSRGTVAVSPARGTEYTLTAHTLAGVSSTRRVAVNVVRVLSFQATPGGPVNLRQPVTLSWETEGAESVRIEPSDESTQPALPTAGSLVVRPDTTTTYQMRAIGAGGQSASAGVVVPVRGPVITNFYVVGLPVAVNQGDALQLNWTVDASDRLQLHVNRGVLRGGSADTLDVTDVRPPYLVTATQPGPTQYTLTASNAVTQTSTTITVNVRPLEVNISKSLIYVQRAGAKDFLGTPMILDRSEAPGAPSDPRTFGNLQMSYFGSWSVAREEIAYDVISSDTERRIYRVGPSGRSAVVVTPPDWAAWNPIWSPNGKFIVFAATNSVDHHADLYTIDMDTQVISQLTFNAKWHQHPSWSPDGKYIAYESDQSGSWNLWIQQVDPSAKPAGPPVQVTFGTQGREYNNPVWTPDGAGITHTIATEKDVGVYLTPVSLTGTGDTLSANAGQSQRLIDGKAGYGVLSPDGKTIVFIREAMDGKRQIFAAPMTDRSNIHALTPDGVDAGTFIYTP